MMVLLTVLDFFMNIIIDKGPHYFTGIIPKTPELSPETTNFTYELFKYTWVLIDSCRATSEIELITKSNVRTKIHETY